jgi:hypothetical protein
MTYGIIPLQWDVPMGMSCASAVPIFAVAQPAPLV